MDSENCSAKIDDAAVFTREPSTTPAIDILLALFANLFAISEAADDIANMINRKDYLGRRS